MPGRKLGVTSLVALEKAGSGKGNYSSTSAHGYLGRLLSPMLMDLLTSLKGFFALAGVVLWIEGRPVNQKVAGLIHRAHAWVVGWVRTQPVVVSLEH